MKLKLAFRSTTAISALLAASVASATSLTPIPFTGNSNIQSNLISSGPSGTFTTPNGFATRFSVPASGDNFAVVSAGGPLTIAGLAFKDVTDVYTLINAYAPAPGATIGAVTFDFVGGTSETINLVSGTNVRDYYDGLYENAITAPNVENAFTYTDTQGGAGSNDTSNGLRGTYVVDEQDFSLGTAAVGKVLSGIEVTSVSGSGANNGSGAGSPLVLGVTVEGTPVAVPEPSTWTMLVVGLAGLGALRRRRSPAIA